MGFEHQTRSPKLEIPIFETPYASQRGAVLAHVAAHQLGREDLSHIEVLDAFGIDPETENTIFPDGLSVNTEALTDGVVVALAEIRYEGVKL